MSSQLMLRSLLAAVLVLSCIGCSESDRRAHERAGPASDHPPGPVAVAVPPEPSPEPDAGTPPALEPAAPAVLPANAEEMLSRLSAGDRERVLDFYRGYGGAVLDFHNADMYAWMARNDYPLPEDILTAAYLSDHELEARYRRGDIKAGYFLLDRMARAIEQGEEDTFQGYLLAEELTTYGGPFSGYAYYRYQMARGQVIDAWAGLAWAHYLGDKRASREWSRQYDRHQGPETERDAISVMLRFQYLLVRATGLNPAQLQRKDSLIIEWR
ncbi:MAG: hypothetical protein ACK4RW_10495 [Rehaibacterium terrae]|uniref:hypothetical protein n=1 Tax=Rehaibacterium terrae TaxID=1341696 RepID=UPI0039188897